MKSLHETFLTLFLLGLACFAVASASFRVGPSAMVAMAATVAVSCASLSSAR
jgi:hypothetical protein